MERGGYKGWCGSRPLVMEKMNLDSPTPPGAPFVAIGLFAGGG
jgi:hypothetical protein